MSEFLNETMRIPEARWIVAGTCLVFGIMIAIYVTFLFRDLAVGKVDEDQGSVDLLSDFRRMQEAGHLADSEFSKLKTVIPDNKKSRTVERDNSDNQQVVRSEQKRFISLAEAQRMKQQNQQDSETNQADEARESE